jgi:hypothetical protein
MHVYTTVSRTMVNIPKERRHETLKFFFPLLPFVISLFVLQHLEITTNNALEILVLNGLVFSHLSVEQIIAITSKSEYIFFHFDSFAYMLALIGCLFVSYKIQVIILCVYAIVALLRYLNYAIGVTWQILNYLNINF